jgi:hypothetical protein
MPIAASTIFFLFLISAPGALLTFGFSGRGPSGPGLNWSTRFWIGLALSPFLVASELMLLKAVGLGFPSAARVVLALACLGFALLVYRWKPLAARPDAVPAIAVTGAVLGVFCGILWIAWGHAPEVQFRSFHALHHTDICYAVTNPPVVPRDPALAGSAIRYPFLAHHYWAWLGWFLDLPPNVLYRWTNTVWLLAVGALHFGFARRLAIPGWLCAVSVVLLLTGNNLIATASDVYRGEYLLDTPLGDGRYSSFLQKFYSFNIMPFALALAASVMTLCAQMLHGAPRRGSAVLLAVCLAAVGTVYPLIFPPLCVSAATAVLLLVVPIAGREARVRGREAGALVACAVAATAIAAAFFLFYLGGRGGVPILEWTASAFFKKSGYAIIALSPLFALALPAMRRGIRRFDLDAVFALALLASSVGFYVLVSLTGENQYKVVFLATMVLAALAAKSLTRPLRDRRWLTLTAVVLVTACVAWLDLARLDLMSVSRRRPVPPRFQLDSFRLKLAEGEAGAGWTTAIREQTPGNTVVIAPRFPIPPSVVTQRDGYVPGAKFWFGYAVAPRTMVVDVRGADPEVYRERAKLRKWLYGGSAASYDAVYAGLAALRRPVAIRFDSDRHPFLDYMRQRRRGRPLELQGSGAVWFIDSWNEPRSPARSRSRRR